MTVILIIIRLWVLQRFLAVTEGFACSEDVTAELERRSGAGAVMRSCSDSHVPGYMHALMCVRQCVCDSSSCCDLEASHVSPLGPWKGGLMQSSCICVCYSGSAISLECSTSCQIKVTPMVCTHTSTESPRWLKKAWNRGDGVTVDAHLHVWPICFHSCSNFARSFLRLDAWIFSMPCTVMKYRFVRATCWTICSSPPMSLIKRKKKITFHTLCLLTS